MCGVRTAATVVVGADAQAEIEAARWALAAARAALAQLEAGGFGEHFGPDAVPSEVRSFQENVRRLAEEEAAGRRLRAEAAEHKARGDAPLKALRTLSELQARAAQHEAEAANLRDILARQKTIRGFWVAPSKGYVQKASEVRQLEARLRQLEDAVES